MEAKTYTSTLEESAIVEHVARIVSSVRGTRPDYTRLAAELEQAIPFDIFGVVLLMHNRQAARVTVCRRKGNSWVACQHQHPCDGSQVEQVLQSPTLIVKNYPDGLDGPPAVSGDALSGCHELRSTLTVPLVVEERILGTVELGSTVLGVYSNETLQRLISAVVRVLATAIESAQLGGSAAIQDRQRQVLKDVTSALTAKMDLSTILNQIVEGIAKALNVASMIVILDRRAGKFFLEAQSGLDIAALHHVFQRNPKINDKCIVGQTLLRRLPFVSQDIEKDDRFPHSREFFTDLGMHSIFSYPLATGTTVYGTLLLCSPEPGGFTPLKADILSLFASQATVAIHNGMLLESAQQRSRFQRAIERLEQTLGAGTSNPLYMERLEASEVGNGASELELLVHVREEAQRIFGVSLSSLLRFVSNNLLTQSERNLREVLYTDGRDQSIDPLGMSFNLRLADTPVETLASSILAQQEVVQDEETDKHTGSYVDNLELLTQTAEAALERAGMLGELGRLLLQLKQSTDWVKDAWFVVDLNGFCRYMNPAAESLCDKRLDDVSTVYNDQFLSTSSRNGSILPIGDLFVNLLPRVRNAEEVRKYLQDFTQGSMYRQELRYVLASDPVCTQVGGERRVSEEGQASDRHYQLTRYPLYDQHGQPGANALRIYEVTEQVREEKNRSVLLSAVSHDLRTPLTTIKAAVTGLLQTDVAWNEQDRRDMLEDIDAEADHLTVLVNALVELSRIEMGALILEKEWCDVVEVLHGAVARMERMLTGKQVRLKHGRLPLIFADHAQLERVFYNLIENAVRRSPAQAEVTILLDVIGEEAEMLRVQVIDHGGGIPEHERERILTSFYNMHSHGNEPGGSGLSLAICKGIVEAHQGRIWVEAVADGGTCFIFTLPTQPHAVVHVDAEAISSAKRSLVEEEGGQQDPEERIMSSWQACEPVEEQTL